MGEDRKLLSDQLVSMPYVLQSGAACAEQIRDRLQSNANMIRRSTPDGASEPSVELTVDTMRWLPDTNHTPSGQYCAAMVADVTTGGVHRTFFTKQGVRSNKSAKMMLGPCAGGVVRLSESVGPLVVCEGI